jgi:hypothetical protein
VVTAVEGNEDLRPSKVLEGSGFDHHDLPGWEFLLPLGLIRVEAAKNVVVLIMSFREVTLELLGLLLLIDRLGRLENLICKTLESVTVSGLVLSLGVKNANAIQQAFEFTRPGPTLLVAKRPFHRVDRTTQFSLLVVALG